MKIRKAVIPVAGKGIRMLPATKAIPKELMPLGTTPVIHYVVEEAVKAGVQEIVFVISNGKEDILKYFSRSLELETFLEKNNKFAELELIQKIGNMVDLTAVYQKEQLGLGHAILQVEQAVGKESFAVLLGDDLVFANKSSIEQLAEVSEKNNMCSVLGIMDVKPEHTNRYGMIKGVEKSKGHYVVESMIEKPSSDKAPSLLGVAGRYILSPDIFKELKAIERGVGGEYQLTDALNRLCASGTVHACKFEGQRYDVGNYEGYVEAFNRVTAASAK